MKDIKYFLEEEYKYCQTEREEVEVWDEEMRDWDYKRIPLDFLRQKPFQREYGNIAYKKELTKEYDLSDAELTMLGLFIMHYSQCFRDDYYGDVIPEIAKNMFEVLDRLIAKAPQTTRNLLFRFCVDEDKHGMKIGDIVLFPHNLTCTEEKWNRNDNNIYVITPLADGRTRAHDIYKMYPHNEKERQVNFLRGTQFLIKDVQDVPGTEYHEFYMDEIE